MILTLPLDSYASKDNILVDYNIFSRKKSSFFCFSLNFFVKFDKIGLMENLIEALTAKNSEYIHSVTKQLMLAGKTDEEVKTILNEILPKIIEAQKNGVLARKLLGSPTEFVEKYAPQKTQAKGAASANDNDKPVLMWLDTALLFFGFIALVSGVLSIFDPKSQIYGLTLMVIMAALGSLVLYLFYRFYYAQEPGKRRWTVKRILISVGVVIAWAVLSSMSALLPTALNPLLNGYVTAVIGAIALGAKFLLKRKFHIRSPFAPIPNQK